MTEFLPDAGELPARPTLHVAAQRSGPRKARARARTFGAGEGLDGENDVLGSKRLRAVLCIANTWAKALTVGAGSPPLNEIE
jgi:hypothetical protein